MIGWIFRFYNYSRKQIESKNGKLTFDDLNIAEMSLIKMSFFKFEFINFWL